MQAFDKKNGRFSSTKKKAVETAFFYSIRTTLNITAECIAGFQLAAIEAALEPLGALGGCAMIEAFRNNITLTTALQRVITDLVCRIQSFFKVACFQNTLLLRVVTPYTGEAIGLKLNTNRHLVGLRFAHLLTHLVELGQNAKQVLDMVPDLMRKDIGLCEIAGSAKTVCQFLIETQIDVELAIAGAIKRPGRRGSKAASRTNLSGKEHHGRRRVGLAA